MSTEREDINMDHFSQKNADDAQAWDDEIPAPEISGDGQILGSGADTIDIMGAAIAEVCGDVFEEPVASGPDIGPIEFQGQEDYIRGATHCLRGMDIVGSVAQAGATLAKRLTTRPAVLQGRAQFVKATSPIQKRIHTAMVIPKTMKRKSNAVTIANARASAKFATQVADKLDKVAAQAQKKPAAPVKPTRAVVGALPIKRKPLTLAQVKKLASDLRNDSKKSSSFADKHTNVVKTFDAKQAAGVKAAAVMLKPKGATGVHGIMGELVGVGNPFEDVIDEAQEAYDILGEQSQILGALLESFVIGGTPDPTNPGYNTDGTQIPVGPGDVPDNQGFMTPSGAFDPNPAYGAIPPFVPGGAGATGTTGTTDGSYSSGRYPGPETNYGMAPAPTMATAQAEYMNPANFMSEPDGGVQTQYNASNVDELKARYTGAIPFTFDLGSSHVPPFKGITSYNTWVPKKDAPYADGSDGNHPNAGFEWHGSDGSRWFVYWPTSVSSSNPPSADEANNLDVMFDHSGAHGWGPLVGDPNKAEWAGLRYAYGSGGAGAPMFFWFRDKAPAWATAQEVLVMYNQMLTDYNTDLTTAKANYATQVTQDFADAQTAASIAKTSSAENAAAAHQADLAAQADAVTQQQLATQQQQQDQAYQAQQDQAQAQQQQLQFQQQQAETAAYAQWLQSGGAQQQMQQPTMYTDTPQNVGPFDDVEQPYSDGGPQGYESQGGPFEDAQPMPTEDDAASFDQAADASNYADASEAEINSSASKRPSADDLDFEV